MVNFIYFITILKIHLPYSSHLLYSNFSLSLEIEFSFNVFLKKYQVMYLEIYKIILNCMYDLDRMFTF